MRKKSVTRVSRGPHSSRGHSNFKLVAVAWLARFNRWSVPKLCGPWNGSSGRGWQLLTCEGSWHIWGGKIVVGLMKLQRDKKLEHRKQPQKSFEYRTWVPSQTSKGTLPFNPSAATNGAESLYGPSYDFVLSPLPPPPRRRVKFPKNAVQVARAKARRTYEYRAPSCAGPPFSSRA